MVNTRMASPGVALTQALRETQMAIALSMGRRCLWTHIDIITVYHKTQW